jgi:eukaryotic-like serine/threonine-protein kinase
LLRYLEAEDGTSAELDMEIACLKDFSRSIDYLETRPELDHDKLAYYGVSFGSRISSIMLAIDKRGCPA